MQSHDSASSSCTPFAPFVHLVKEICDDTGTVGKGLRWQRDALVALQLTTEDFLVMVFEMTYGPAV